MSRQPRKVFGFTGAAKYGPVADGEEKKKEEKKTASGDKSGTPPSDSCYQCINDFLTCAWLAALCCNS